MPGDAATIGRSPTARSTSRSQQLALAAQPLALLGLADREQHFGRLERLGEVVVGAAAHRFERQLLGSVRGHQDQRGVGPAPRELRQQREAVDARHPQIAEHDVGHRVLEAGERVLAAAREGDLVAFGAQHQREAFPQRIIVVHDQNALRHGHTPPNAFHRHAGGAPMRGRTRIRPPATDFAAHLHIAVARVLAPSSPSTREPKDNLGRVAPGRGGDFGR